jgi:hypothetical protein
MPGLSVILCVDRPATVMTGLPDLNHLEYTIQSGLKRQSFKGFELIISDACGVEFPKNVLRTPFPIYHVPVDHNPRNLQAARNNGLAYADGDFLVFLRDCVNMESMFLDKILEDWEELGMFASPLWIQECGGRDVKIPGKGIVRDSRFELLKDHDILIDDFDLDDYFSCTLEAALKVGGFNELGQVKEFGDDLKKEGFHTSVNRKIVLKEQKVGYEPTVPDLPVSPVDIHRLREHKQKIKQEFLVMKPNRLT